MEWVNAVVNELRNRGKKFVSLDKPSDQDGYDIATDILAGFTPVVGTATAARDYERARRENDYLGMGLSAVGMIPVVGGVTKLLRGGSKAQDLISALRAEKGIPTDPEDFTAANKAALTKLEKQWNSTPSLRNREAIRGGDTVIRDAQELDPRPIINPESLLGKYGVQVQGDRTAAGKILEEVNGVKLDAPVHLQGGPDYPRVHAAHDSGAAWASMQGAARNKQNQFARVADQVGEAPLGIYSAMSLNDGSNFSHHVAQSMVNQLRELDLPKKVINQINKEVWTGGANAVKGTSARPDFLGLGHPELMDQLLGRGAFTMEGAGEMRKALVNALRKPGIQDLGVPHFDDTIRAVTEPALLNVPNYASGYTIFRSNPEKGLIKSVGDSLSHQSYDTMIPGTYLGGLERSIPAEIMFPETYRKHRALGRNDQQTGRSMFLNGEDFEKFDQKWLDGVMNYLGSAGR